MTSCAPPIFSNDTGAKPPPPLPSIAVPQPPSSHTDDSNQARDPEPNNTSAQENHGSNNSRPITTEKKKKKKKKADYGQGDYLFDPMDHANLCNISGCTCQVQGNVICLIESIKELMENCVTDPPLDLMFKHLLADFINHYDSYFEQELGVFGESLKQKLGVFVQRQRWVGNCNYVKQLMELKKKITVYHKLHMAKDEEARKQEEAKLKKQRILLRRKLLEVVFDCVGSLEDSPLICNSKEKPEPMRRDPRYERLR